VVVGVDYLNAVEAASKNLAGDENVCIVQADALRLPFKDNVFDGAFSIGVLHHTPSPRTAVSEAYRVVKKSGWFALSVYGKSGYYDFPSVQAWRKLFKILWPVLGHYPPLIYSYVTTYLVRPIGRVSRPVRSAIRLFFPLLICPKFAGPFWTRSIV